MKTIANKSEQKFQKVMHEFGKGELKSNDNPVKDQKQALAIAFSEARKIYPNYGMKVDGGKLKDNAVKGIFYLDAMEKELPGYTFGDYWNGFEVPYFEKPEANLIREALGGTYRDGKYFFDDGYEGEEEYEKETIDTVDGKKDVYPIGAYNWTWSSPEKKTFKFYFKDQPSFTLTAVSVEDADEIYRTLTAKEAKALGIKSKLYEGVEPERIEEVAAQLVEGGVTGAELEKIYTTGTAKQLWEVWPADKRIHFLMDHATEFFELMGDDFYKSSDSFSTLTYDTLPSPIRKSIVIHHAQGMYKDGATIGYYNGGVIGDKKATEIIKYAIDAAKKEGIELPKMEAFLKKGPEPGVLLEAYEEFRYHFNNGGNKKSLRFAYEDSNRLTNYVMSMLPNEKQREMYNHYGDVPIKKNFPDYKEGAEIKGEGVDLFEDYENIPAPAQKIIDKYEEGFTDGDYSILAKALKEMEKIGYTFEYYLDGQAYDLRQIGQIGKVGYAEKHHIGLFADERFQEFYKIVKKSDSFSDFWDALSKIQVPGDVADAFDERYNPNKKLSLKESFKTFYDEVKVGLMVEGGTMPGEFKKPNIKMDNDLYQDLSKSSVRAIDYIGKEKVLKAYQEKPIGTVWDIYHEVSLQKNNSNHPSVDNGSGRRVIAYDPSFRASTNKLYDSHIESAMKSIFKQIFSDIKMAEGSEISGLQKGDRILDNKTSKEGIVRRRFKPAKGSALESEAYLIDIRYDDGKGAINMPVGDRFVKVLPQSSVPTMNNGGPAGKLSPAKKKLLERITTLKGTLNSANPKAQKAIQQKIDVLQKQFDYNPSVKERAMANKGKFALDVPTKHSKYIYKKLWSMKIHPSIHNLNGNSSIVVKSQNNLDKAYKIYSDLLKSKGEPVQPLSKISRKL